MAGWLVVLVDNKDYVAVSRLRESDSGAINLTTMLPDQEHASVELYFRGPRYLEHIHTFSLHELRRTPERPRIVVSAHVRGKVHVTLRIEGEICDERSFEIPAEVHRISVWPIVLAALLVLFAGGISALAVLRPFQDARSAGAPSVGSAPVSRTLPGGVDVAGALAGDSAEPREETEQISGADSSAAAEQADEPQLPPVTVDSTLYFEPESALLLPQAQAQIAAVATRIAESGAEPPALRVSGHTALFGNAEARLALSRDRAAAVAEQLRRELADRQIDNVDIEVEGLGGAEPVTRAVTEQWQNRRVELTSR